MWPEPSIQKEIGLGLGWVLGLGLRLEVKSNVSVKSWVRLRLG